MGCFAGFGVLSGKFVFGKCVLLSKQELGVMGVQMLVIYLSLSGSNYNKENEP